MTRSLQSASLLLALCLAGAALAHAPGSPESNMEYGQEYFDAGSWSSAATYFEQVTTLQPGNPKGHFMLAAALASDGKWDEARESFARAAALQPDLQAQADAWLARAPASSSRGTTLPTPPPALGAAAPQRPPARAQAAAPAAAAGSYRQFAVGDRVEVMYREGFWVPGIVTASDPGACPYHRVSADAYGDGKPSELGYFCKSVRAPTGVAAPVAACGGSNDNCAPTTSPPLGDYGCTEQVWQGPGVSPAFRPKFHGTLTLMAGGRYRHLDGGETGSYRYDPGSHAIAWTGGGLAGRDAVASYGLDGDTPEITIEFPSEYTRRTGNSPPRWQCGLQD